MQLPADRRHELYAKGLKQIAASGENDFRRFLLVECLEALPEGREFLFRFQRNRPVPRRLGGRSCCRFSTMMGRLRSEAGFHQAILRVVPATVTGDVLNQGR